MFDGINDNQIFFLKRRLSDWLKYNFISLSDLKYCLSEEHKDATKESDAMKYIEDVTKIFKVFGVDIYDQASYN